MGCHLGKFFWHLAQQIYHCEVQGTRNMQPHLLYIYWKICPLNKLPDYLSLWVKWVPSWRLTVSLVISFGNWRILLQIYKLKLEFWCFSLSTFRIREQRNKNLNSQTMVCIVNMLFVVSITGMCQWHWVWLHGVCKATIQVVLWNQVEAIGRIIYGKCTCMSTILIIEHSRLFPTLLAHNSSE